MKKWYLLCLVVLAGCGEGVEMECQISHVAGKFTVDSRELERAQNQRGGNTLVNMYRGHRHFMWPLDRVVGCAEPENEQ